MTDHDPPDPADLGAWLARPLSDADRAAALRAAYVAAVRAHHARRTGAPSRYNSKPAWDGGFDPRTGRTYRTPVWPGLVARAEAAGCDPADLVRALFEGWAGDDAPPPRLLLGPEVVRRCGAAARRREAAVVFTLRADEAHFRSAVWAAQATVPDPEAAVRVALSDLGRPISPLFRHAAARLRGLPDCADQWAEQARRQLARAPAAYLKYWAALLTPDLAADARRMAAGDPA